MLPPFLRRTFSVENALSNGIWGAVYTLVFAAVGALVPVALHAATSLSWPWLVVVGFAVFCLLLAGTLALWARSPEPGDSKPGGSSSEMTLIAAEKEIARLREEAYKLKELLMNEWPYLSSQNEELEQAITDWRLKTTDFIDVILGPGHRAGFKTVAPEWTDAPDQLEAEAKFLSDLGSKLSPDSLRVTQEDFLGARKRRRENMAAKFLGYDSVSTPTMGLAKQLDSLIREGKELVAELSIPVQPERLNWVSKIVGGGPPAEWQEKADAFRQRSMDLLEARHPALVTDLRDGVKRHFEMEQEVKEKHEREAKADTRSDAEKMLALANFERSGPRREVEAWLEGLALARKAI